MTQEFIREGSSAFSQKCAQSGINFDVLFWSRRFTRCLLSFNNPKNILQHLLLRSILILHLERESFVGRLDVLCFDLHLWNDFKIHFWNDFLETFLVWSDRSCHNFPVVNSIPTEETSTNFGVTEKQRQETMKLLPLFC